MPVQFSFCRGSAGIKICLLDRGKVRQGTFVMYFVRNAAHRSKLTQTEIGANHQNREVKSKHLPKNMCARISRKLLL